jgi:hypothetical protein
MTLGLVAVGLALTAVGLTPTTERDDIRTD